MVDALCSGRSVRKDVLVRIQSWAQCPFSIAERAFLFVSVASLLYYIQLFISSINQGTLKSINPIGVLE